MNVYYVCMCVCVCVCMYTHTHTHTHYIYIYTHTHTQRQTIILLQHASVGLVHLHNTPEFLSLIHKESEAAYCLHVASLPSTHCWQPRMMICMLLSDLRQVHSLYQSEFSAERDLVLPLSVSCVFSFPHGHPVAAYVFFLFFPSLLFFPLSIFQ